MMQPCFQASVVNWPVIHNFKGTYMQLCQLHFSICYIIYRERESFLFLFFFFFYRLLAIDSLLFSQNSHGITDAPRLSSQPCNKTYFLFFLQLLRSPLKDRLIYRVNVGGLILLCFFPTVPVKTNPSL